MTRFGIPLAESRQRTHEIIDVLAVVGERLILVLPIWDPLRLAEEVAVLDNLTDGRFICGIGRGYQPHEMARFGIPLEESRRVPDG